jgi:hypothetical protein
MESISDEDLSQWLSYISEQINRYLSPIIFIFGTVGNVLNCLVLSQRKFRTNSCALLFLVSSLVSLISILFGLTTRIMAGWNDDPSATINWICKVRAFIVFSTRTMAIWLIMLATVDRWLLSSIYIHRRQMGSIQNVRRGIIASLILSSLSYSHMLFCNVANMINQPLQCYGTTYGCRLMTDLTYGLISNIIPFVLMVSLGLMTISNVHNVHNRVQHLVEHSKNIEHVVHKDLHLKKTDHHLLRMLLVQAVVLIMFCVPQAVQQLYMTFKPFGSVSHRQDIINVFLYNLEVLMAFIASCMPFYVYTLAGGIIFRKAFGDLVRTAWQKIKF